MPTVEFAPALTRHVACPRQQVQAPTLGAALQAAFRAAPGLAAYVLDEQGAVRKHVAVFLNGEMLPRDTALAHAVAAEDRVLVMQALTGG